MNWLEMIAKILKEKVVRKVNGGLPDRDGNTDLSYMARQDQANTFSNVQTFSGGIGCLNIGSGTDVNSISKSGWYRCTDQSSFATLLNAPAFERGFLMQVVGQGTQYSTQIAWTVTGTNMAIRSGSTIDNKYGAWRYVVTSADPAGTSA